MLYNKNMTKKQIITIVIAALVVVAILLIGWFVKDSGVTQKETEQKETEMPKINIPEGGYTKEIPEEVITITKPESESAGSPDPAIKTKLLSYDIKATKNGFIPSVISVGQGDSVSFNFTAVDGDYDLDFPYLGAYFSVVKQGATKSLPFSTNLAGSFAFECRSSCPDGNKIQGVLYVLPPNGE